MPESDIDKAIAEHRGTILAVREMDKLRAGLEERVARPDYPVRSVASLLLYLMQGKAFEPDGAELVLNSVDELQSRVNEPAPWYRKA